MSKGYKKYSGINVFVKNAGDKSIIKNSEAKNDDYEGATLHIRQSAKSGLGLGAHLAEENNEEKNKLSIGAFSIGFDKKNKKETAQTDNDFINLQDQNIDNSKLIQAINEKPAITPFIIAAMLSICWFIIAITILIDRNELQQWQQIFLFDGNADIKGTFVSLFSLIVFPSGLFWAIAALTYRLQQTKIATKTLIKTAAVISQPQKQAKEAIASLSNAVRREIYAINQGVEKAFERTVQVQEIINNQIQVINHTCFQQKNMLDGTIDNIGKQKDSLIAAMEELQIQSVKAFEPMARENIRIRGIVQDSLEHVDSATGNLKHNLDKFHQITSKIVLVSEKNCKNISETVVELENSFEKGNEELNKTITFFTRQNEKLDGITITLRELNHNVEQRLQEKQDITTQMLGNIDKKSEYIIANIEDGAERFLKSIGESEDRVGRLAGYLREKGTKEVKNLVDDFQNIAKNFENDSIGTVKKIQQGYDETIENIKKQSKEAAISLNKDVRDMNSIAKLTAQDVALTKEKLEIAIKQLPRTAERTNADLKNFIDAQADIIKNLAHRLYEAIEKIADVQNINLTGNNSQLRFENSAKENLAAHQTNTTINQNTERKTKWALNELLSNARKAEQNENDNYNRQKNYSNDNNRLAEFNWNASDLVQAFSDVDVIQLWKKHNQGESRVFNQRIYTKEGLSLFNEIQSRYRYDKRFQDDIDQYLNEFEALLTAESESGSGGKITEAYLTSETGRIYMVLAHAAGRLD